MSETNYDASSVSPSVSYLINGYVDYARAVICERALASLYDGLKPVHRRIIYTLDVLKVKDKLKSSNVTGKCLTYHPHSPSAVYEAAVLMTEKNGSWAFPLLTGQGSFGGFFKTDPAAAERYTSLGLNKEYTDQFLGEMNGIQFVPNFDSTTTEPELLPVSFPAVLVNSTTGIAVGFRSNIPSFNFVDVCNLVKEYVQKGYCETVIMPDFVGGGYYIRDDKELQKLMTTGTAKIKLRGKANINGKTIDVYEIPYGKTIQGILKQINKKDYNFIKTAYDVDDFDHNLLYTVECKNKSQVQEALYYMCKDTDYQYNFSADITVVQNNKPVRLGVWDVIAEWVKWRRQVIIKNEKVRLDWLLDESKKVRAFMELISKSELKETFVQTASKQGKSKAIEYLKQNFDNDLFDDEVCEWVVTRRLSEFNNGGKYAGKLNDIMAQIEGSKSIIDDVDSEIIRQMNTLIAKFGSRLARRTEVTTEDYNFTEEKGKKEVVKDTSSCHYAFKNGFLRKLRLPVNDNGVQFQFAGTSSDTLVAIDNRGRVLRVYCNELPTHAVSDTGIYLPNYFGLKESDDYKITWIGRLDGRKYMLLYKDGNVGVLDTSEWIGNNRNVRILEKGIARACAEYLGAVVPIDDLDEFNKCMLFVSDTAGRIAYRQLSELKHKDRTAKTRAFNLTKGAEIDCYAIMPTPKGCMLLPNLAEYNGKLKEFNMAESRVVPSDFTMFF